MIDPQIEFFLSDSDDDAVAEPAAAHLTAVSVGRLGGPSALWLAAAGLLVIAPFRLVYALGVRFSEVHQTTPRTAGGGFAAASPAPR